MRKIICVLIAVLFACCLYSQSDSIIVKKIDEICELIERYFQEGAQSRFTPDDIPLQFRGKVSDYHILYICGVYYKDEKSVISIYHKAENGKNILRIGEGMLEIKQGKDFITEQEYYFPEITENIYYFLDGKLVKINEIKSMLDYNVLPRNYWLMFPAVSYYFQDNSLITVGRPGFGGSFLYDEKLLDLLKIRQMLVKAYYLYAQ